MASIAKGSASYKKKDGSLVLEKDSVTWTPANAETPSLKIPVSTITNLQATPATVAKVMIKVFATKEGGAAEPYVFTFTSASSARMEADVMKEALTTSIQTFKNNSGTATPSSASVGHTTTAASSTAASGATSAKLASKLTDWSKTRLETDLELQKSLLKADQELSTTFSEAVLSGAVTADQFWSTRTHLLRAHAIEREQKRGPYNVLATIKSKTVDNVVKMSLSREAIHDIFDQHPLVKMVYDDNVPKLPEEEFWSRFFLSRLFKKLKGDKLLPTDNTDPILDRYLGRGDEENSRKRRKLEHVPRTMDIEGNEQNLSQKKGNAPDLTMRPTRTENVPIIKTLNSLSLKLVDLVTPTDTDPSQVEDQDERYIIEQRLIDLHSDPEEARIILNIRDQRQFFSASSNADKARKELYSNLKPETVLQEIQKTLGESNLNLLTALASGGTSKGSKAQLSKATTQIVAAVKDRREQMLNSSGFKNKSGGLPANVFNSVTLVHATTNEFLRHFWLAFLSGDEKRAGDIVKLVNSLKNSKERIASIAKTADEERELEKVRKKKEAQEEYKRTGVKPKRKTTEVGGGSKVVEELLAPTIVAVDKALGKYQAALGKADKGSRTAAG
ncbi:unnamed protein product [Tuber melanosporum]|uniref:(Perigord truffle) hypothetical protein n=1 Tax=Tuber melanosporum (strain Mel28) TaxID=656061 RepID=D5GM43_TUBMM|nr:uncharacterized protein GSTUM_00010519001 [Tuber melanosporum]CAZ85586.1 unnamed protein product [Tuber melanosporum]